MRILSLLTLLFTLALPAQAQRDSRPTDSPPRDRSIERIDRAVDLTQAQRDQMLALVQNHADGRQARRQQMRTERQRLQSQLVAVLTPEQRATLEARQNQQRQDQIDRRVRQMARRLDLTDEQQTRVRTLLESQPMRPSPESDARERADQMRSRIGEILTPDQRQRLEDVMRRSQRGDRMRGGRVKRQR